MNAEAALRPLLPAALPAGRARRPRPRARARTRTPRGNPAIFAHLDEAADRLRRATRAALFGADLAPRPHATRASTASSAALTRERRDAWAAQGARGHAPRTCSSTSSVHGAAYVGACVVASHGGAWGVRRPLWESVVRLDVARGRGGPRRLPLVAQVAGRRRSRGVDARRSLPRPRRGALRATRGAPGPRRGPRRALPRLKQPRYDLLHKYLRAHLPELRDLGARLPRPGSLRGVTRFRWLDFHLARRRAHGPLRREPRPTGCTSSGSPSPASRRARSSRAMRSPTRSSAWRTTASSS